jgi:hypothetical protein
MANLCCAHRLQADKNYADSVPGAFHHEEMNCIALPRVPIADKHWFQYLNHSMQACGAGATIETHCQFQTHEKPIPYDIGHFTAMKSGKHAFPQSGKLLQNLLHRCLLYQASHHFIRANLLLGSLLIGTAQFLQLVILARP